MIYIRDILHMLLFLQYVQCECVAVCCIVLQCFAVCCSVLQCVAVCCSVLQCASLRILPPYMTNMHQNSPT